MVLVGICSQRLWVPCKTDFSDPKVISIGPAGTRFPHQAAVISVDYYIYNF